MKVKNFLEELDRSGGKLLFEGGKEGDKIDAKVKVALKAANINYIWAFQPSGYDMVILEHDKNGEKKGSWSTAFFTEAELGAKGETGEELFGEEMISEAGVGYKIIDNPSGNFLDIVNLAIEIAGNAKYKKGFTAQNIKMLKAKK